MNCDIKIKDVEVYLISQTRVPLEASLTVRTSVSGTTFWTNTCTRTYSTINVVIIIIIYLFIILITVRTNVIPMAAGQAGQVFLQGNNLEAGQWGGAWLGGDHPPEPRHVPGPHVVVLRTHGHQVLL